MFPKIGIYRECPFTRLIPESFLADPSKGPPEFLETPISQERGFGGPRDYSLREYRIPLKDSVGVVFGSGLRFSVDPWSIVGVE